MYLLTISSPDETPHSENCNHTIDCVVQCAIRTGNHKATLQSHTLIYAYVRMYAPNKHTTATKVSQESRKLTKMRIPCKTCRPVAVLRCDFIRSTCAMRISQHTLLRDHHMNTVRHCLQRASVYTHHKVCPAHKVPHANELSVLFVHLCTDGWPPVTTHQGQPSRPSVTWCYMRTAIRPSHND